MSDTNATNCPYCDGHGYVFNVRTTTIIKRPCLVCAGTGRELRCPDCHAPLHRAGAGCDVREEVES